MPDLIPESVKRDIAAACKIDLAWRFAAIQLQAPGAAQAEIMARFFALAGEYLAERTYGPGPFERQAKADAAAVEKDVPESAAEIRQKKTGHLWTDPVR